MQQLNSTNIDRMRVLELGVVILVAILPLIYNSTAAVLAGVGQVTPLTSSISYLRGVITELASLALLGYVLVRQGRSLRDLGFSFRWRDLPISALLFVVMYIAAYVFALGLYLAYYSLTGYKLDFTPLNVVQSPVSVSYALFSLVNPFFEELVVRAYVQSEVQHFTGRASAGILVSVAIQVSYHLYQGLTAASSLVVVFLIFALYYASQKRIMPVILAHLYSDVLSMLARATF